MQDLIRVQVGYCFDDLMQDILDSPFGKRLLEIFVELVEIVLVKLVVNFEDVFFFIKVKL